MAEADKEHASMASKLKERLKQLQAACEVQSSEMTNLAAEKTKLHEDKRGLKQKLKELHETINQLKVVYVQCK